MGAIAGALHMRSLLQLLSTLAIAVMAATPLVAIAHAHEEEEIRSQTFNPSLSRPADSATFERRVTTAANAICRPVRRSELTDVASCQRALLTNSYSQLWASADDGRDRRSLDLGRALIQAQRSLSRMTWLTVRSPWGSLVV